MYNKELAKIGLGRLGMVQGRLLEEVMANWKAEGQVAVIQRRRTIGRRKAQVWSQQ